jgi:succinate-acetate transporter protein
MTTRSQQYYREKTKKTLALFLLFQILPICFLIFAALSLYNPPDHISDTGGLVHIHRSDIQVQKDFAGCVENAVAFFLLGLPFAAYLLRDYWNTYDSRYSRSHDGT